MHPNSASRSSRSERTAGTLEVGRRIDAGVWRGAGDRDRDAKAMRKRPQLLECFEALDRRGLEARELAQESGAVRVDAEVAVDREPARDRAHAFREGIACVRDRR